MLANMDTDVIYVEHYLRDREDPDTMMLWKID